MTHSREDCHRLADLLSAYIDEELPPDLRQEVIHHFEGCSDCVRFVNSLRRTRDLGQFLPEIALSPEDLRRLAEEAARKLEQG